MSIFSFLKQSGGEDYVVIDVGSGSVGAAGISLHKGGKPRIDYTKRIFFTPKERVQAKTLETETLNAIKEIAADLRKEGKHAEKVALVLASPWYNSQTKIVSIEKDEPFTVTNSFIDEIIETETSRILEKQDDDMKLIESSVANIKINGYSTFAPQGKAADKIDLSLYVSFGPASFLEKIEEEIEKSFSVKNILHDSFPFVAISTIQRIFHSDKDFIFIDIASEITDLVVVKDGSIIGTASFPVGINTLIRKVADRFKITPDLALSFVKLFGEGKANEDLNIQIGKLASAVKEEWQAYFYQVAPELYGGPALSNKAFLTSDDGMSGITSSFTSGLFTSSVFLGDKTLSEFCDFNPHQEHDPFLTIESIYLNSL